MTVDKISLGQFKIYGLRDGYFYLDGGAMFGVVPKTLWEKKSPADKHNRIKLGLNSILIKTGEGLILVETGIGTELDKKFVDYYSVDRKPGLVGALKELGVEVEDIDFVINTHLHFDHCGGNTYKNTEDEIVPTFPKARYIIQEGEWENALHPSYRERQSYLTHNFLPLEKYRCIQLINGDTEITEGIEVLLAPGHTSHHQCVKVHSEGKRLFFLGDLVPTSAHIGLSYIMSYDLYPLDTLENREKFYKKAIEEDWIVAFNHDPEHFFGKIRKIKNKYTFEPLSEQ